MKKIIRKPYYLFFILGLVGLLKPVQANIPIDFTVHEDGKIIIEYSLQGKKNDYHYVTIKAFLDDNPIPINTISGDVNKRIYGSGKKQIIWDVFKDRLKLRGELYFEIIAKQYNPTKPKSDSYSFNKKHNHFSLSWKPGYATNIIKSQPEETTYSFFLPIGLQAEMQWLGDKKNPSGYLGSFISYVQTNSLVPETSNHEWVYGSGIEGLNTEDLNETISVLRMLHFGASLYAGKGKNIFGFYVGFGFGKIQTYQKYREITANGITLPPQYAKVVQSDGLLGGLESEIQIRIKNRLQIGFAITTISGGGVSNDEVNTTSVSVVSLIAGYVLY